MMDKAPTVAVIGLGAMGVVAAKNLVEEGFNVTGFEKSGYVGGLWHYTDDETTLSVLQDTQANVSKDRGCYTDYPFPQGTPDYCSANAIEKYIESYVDHFSLRPHFQLNTTVTSITWEDSRERWRVEFDNGASSRHFDKVVVATGPHARPMVPSFQGQDLFTGSIVHSQAFKRSEQFKDQRVLVVGLGNTGGDVVDALVGSASSVAIAHSHGALIMPRLYNGKPASRLVTQRGINIQGMLEKHVSSSAMEKLINKKAKEIMVKSFGDIDPDWNLSAGPSIKVSPPVVSDTLISHLQSGKVRSVSGIKKIKGPTLVELNDGEEVEVDAIICCTGFRNDFSILDRRFDPSVDPPTAWRNAPGAKDRPLPRLYQNVFSLDKPDSLAFVGCVWFATGAFGLADIASMCIAQVWAGKSTLPPAEERSRWMDRQTERMVGLAHRGTPPVASVSQPEWLRWADETAGAGMFDRMGWGRKGWCFWWTDRALYKMMMDGVLTSASWRVFDEGKRRPWPEAREEIIRLNREA